ncbi:Calcium load-activated calcium channel [Cryptosporidium meleagridis]
MSEAELNPYIEFNKHKILIVIFSAFLASITAELLSYFLFFRKNDFIKMQENLIKSRAKLDKLKLKDKTGIITENTTLSLSYSSKIKKNPKIESLEQSITNLSYKISMIKMKSGILVGILFAALIPLKNTFFGDLPICKLPFEPIKVFRLVTQAGLKNASVDDAGSIFIFGQAFMAFRMAIQKAVYFDTSSSFGRM